jgi:hypothetical protein
MYRPNVTQALLKFNWPAGYTMKAQAKTTLVKTLACQRPIHPSDQRVLK